MACRPSGRRRCARSSTRSPPARTGSPSSARVPRVTSRRVLASDLVVPAAEELHEAETVAEGIRHQRELAPRIGRHGFLKLSPGGERRFHCAVDVLDDEVEMHGRPVPLVSAQAVGWFYEEVYRGGRAEHLHAGRTEAATAPQAEGRGVKAHRLVQVIDIEVDE